LPITGIAVSVADFGSGRTYAVVGLYNPNLVLDSSGNTPDLSNPLTYAVSPPLTPPPLFDYVTYDLPDATIPAGSTKIHSVVELPPGDSGLLTVGGDSNTTHLGLATSGFTTDGYATPAIMMSFIDIGLNPGQDNSTTVSCKAEEREPHGRLRVSNPTQLIGSGDRLSLTIRAGDPIQLAFFGPQIGDMARLYCTLAPTNPVIPREADRNLAPCIPAVHLGPVLTTTPDPDGSGSYLRVDATWPAGYGGRAFQFRAAWGNPACSNPGVGFTNCVTVIAKPDPEFGICDDGTVETGWVVQIPSGSSDYFNNSFGAPFGKVNGVVGLTISVLDFGTSAAGYPTSGVSNANLVVDPSGNTPDIGNPLAAVSPFTFPPGSFETTSPSYTSHGVSIPGGSLSAHVHGWVQFPPGDPGLLGVGGDTTQNNGCSFFSLDGYSSPAISFFVNWGIRIKTN
jgi:hypothetical protein